MRQRLFLCLAALLFTLAGFAGAMALFSYLQSITLNEWVLPGTCLVCLCGAVLLLFFSLPKISNEEFKVHQPYYDRFIKECKMAIRGHLKLSVLFWIAIHRKEKVRSFEDSIFVDFCSGRCDGDCAGNSKSAAKTACTETASSCKA